MNRTDLIESIVKLLEQHKNGMRGSIHQEPYKSDFFQIFSCAFNAGFIDSPNQSDYLSADALADTINSRAPELFDCESWHDLYRFWSEWTYAWRQIHLFSR